jgi:hypothetical protein
MWACTRHSSIFFFGWLLLHIYGSGLLFCKDSHSGFPFFVDGKLQMQLKTHMRSPAYLIHQVPFSLDSAMVYNSNNFDPTSFSALFASASKLAFCHDWCFNVQALKHIYIYISVFDILFQTAVLGGLACSWLRCQVSNGSGQLFGPFPIIFRLFLSSPCLFVIA